MIEMININSFHESKNNFRLIKKVLIEKIWAMKKMSFSGKYTAKMFSLKRFLVSECILKLIFSVRVVRNQNQGYVSLKCIPWKIFEQVGVGMLYLHMFFNYNTWNRYSCRNVFKTFSNISDRGGGGGFLFSRRKKLV